MVQCLLLFQFVESHVHTFYFSVLLVLQVTKFYVVVPSIFRSLVWNVGSVNLPAPGILRWQLDFWEIFPPLL